MPSLDQGVSSSTELDPRNSAPAVAIDPRAETQDAASVAEAMAPVLSDLFQPGDLLGGMYRIKKRLGEGGMGQVWDAYDEALVRPVAIKAAWPHIGSAFLRQEGQALAALRHPSIPVVHSLASDQGVHFLVMERLQGRTLEQVLEEKARQNTPMGIEEALDILSALTEGLGVIHGAGISHRDIKPANIMLAPQGRVVFIDFGIFVPECATTTQLTTSGTPYYMAPEVILGDVASGYGYLADLYALGVLAYQLLALRLPFDGKSHVDIMFQHVNSPAPSLSSVRPDVPRSVEVLVDGLLAKSPMERPNSAQAVLAQVAQIRRGLSQRQSMQVPATAAGASQASTLRRPAATLVVVVDDDPAELASIEWQVRQIIPDAEVVPLANAAQAAQLLRDREPAFLLIDVDMPQMNGFDLFAYLRAHKLLRESVVVMMSASASPSDVEMARRLGINHHVGKGPMLGRLLRPILARRDSQNSNSIRIRRPTNF
jgi:serine/threonine-protein kinase